MAYSVGRGERKDWVYPTVCLLAFVGLLVTAPRASIAQVLAAAVSLAIVLGKKEDFGLHSLALAASLFILFFSRSFVSFLSAWLLVDAILLWGWGDRGSIPGHLFSQSAGILAFLGWEHTKLEPLLFLSAFARAGFFPWPRSYLKSRRLAFLPVVLAFYLLSRASLPGSLWLLAFGLWLAFGSGVELGKKEGFPQALWGITLSFAFYKLWSLPILIGALAVASLREPIERAWKKAEVIVPSLRKIAWNAAEFLEGEGGWLWVGIGFAALLLRLGQQGEGLGLSKIFWRELFPEGLGLLSAALYLLVAESDSAILFSLLAQYIMAAFYKSYPTSGNWLILAKVALGAMVCFILYLSRWGAKWLLTPGTASQGKKAESWWLLRLVLGLGGGFLAFALANRYPLFSPSPEERLIVFWLVIIGLLGTLAPGSVLQRAAGILTFLNGLELTGLILKPMAWFIHPMIALGAAFLSAYERAGGR
jgi:hypothetical protein